MSHENYGQLRSKILEALDTTNTYKTRFLQEFDYIKGSIDDLTSERNATLSAFVEEALPSLFGESFDRFNALTEGEAVLAASFAHQRDQALSERKKALASTGHKTVESFKAAKTGAQKAVEEAIAACDAIEQTEEDAKKERNTSSQAVADSLYLDFATELSPETRALFNAKNIGALEPPTKWTSHLWAKLTSTPYREIQYGLKAFGLTTASELLDRVEKAKLHVASRQRLNEQGQKKVTEAEQSVRETTQQRDTLVLLAPAVRTDDEILSALRATAKVYMAENASFRSSAQAAYGEKFPQKLNVLEAKISLLTKLKDSTWKQVTELRRSKDVLFDQSRKIPASLVLKKLPNSVNLAQIKENNQKRAKTYEALYRENVRVRTYTVNAVPSPTVIQTHSSPSALESFFIYDMLCDHGNSSRGLPHGSSASFAPANDTDPTPTDASPAAAPPVFLETAPYTMHLLGLHSIEIGATLLESPAAVEAFGGLCPADDTGVSALNFSGAAQAMTGVGGGTLGPLCTDTGLQIDTSGLSDLNLGSTLSNIGSAVSNIGVDQGPTGGLGLGGGGGGGGGGGLVEAPSAPAETGGWGSGGDFGGCDCD